MSKHHFVRTTGGDYTFAIRMYDIARGRGLSKDFALATIADFQSHVDTHSTWLETDTRNTAAVHLYNQLGYRTVNIHDARLVMMRNAC